MTSTPKTPLDSMSNPIARRSRRHRLLFLTFSPLDFKILIRILTFRYCRGSCDWCTACFGQQFRGLSQMVQSPEERRLQDAGGFDQQSVAISVQPFERYWSCQFQLSLNATLLWGRNEKLSTEKFLDFVDQSCRMECQGLLVAPLHLLCTPEGGLYFRDYQNVISCKSTRIFSKFGWRGVYLVRKMSSKLCSTFCQEWPTNFLCFTFV